jgi:predicted translation initiation factor SUI1
MKLTDLSKLDALLSPDQKQELAREEATTKAKRKIGEGQDVRVILDKKARRGKAVTMIEDLHLSSEMRDILAKELKQKLSVGGTVYQDVIELQGDHTARVVEYLKQQGFTVRTK